jgi:L-threonylcarbamoyladenylate synthase
VHPRQAALIPTGSAVSVVGGASPTAAISRELLDMLPLATRVLPAGTDAIEAAAVVLAEGGLVAFPTETVYGLGADATCDSAVAKLYAAKERPAFNPLIAHVPDFAAARRLALFDDEAVALATAFWPGPLTLVLRKRDGCLVGQLATAGLETIAVRVPNYRVARDILRAFGKPVVAPSANRSGLVSPTSAQHVLADLAGRINLIVDDGPSPVGVESTIVACLGQAMLLRPGAIPRANIERILGRVLAPIEGEAAVATNGNLSPPPAPGMLASHYAPRAAVRLHAATVMPGEALLAFGPNLAADARQAAATLNLSAQGDLAEAAANLFAHLRTLDSDAIGTIAVMPIPAQGLGEAINDRLRHAAAPRRGA